MRGRQTSPPVSFCLILIEIIGQNFTDLKACFPVQGDGGCVEPRYMEKDPLTARYRQTAFKEGEGEKKGLFSKTLAPQGFFDFKAIEAGAV